MSVFYKAIFLGICGALLLSSLPLKGQDPAQTVTGDFSNVPFETLVQAVERQTTYRFYYDRRQTDTLRVNVRANNTPLPALLESVFEGLPFNFAIDQFDNVFVTHGRIIQVELPIGYFDRRPDAANQEEQEIVVDFYEERQRSEDAESQKLYEIGIKTNTIRPGNATISGRVMDAETGEGIVGAAVFIENPLIGVSADPLGYYSITLPRGRHLLKISSLGMRTAERQVLVYSDGKLDVELAESVQSLKEVVVEAERGENVARPQMGIEKMDIKTIKQIPTAFGEADVLRVVQALPGVSTVGEASTGFNVRGGSTDQNLILLNDAVIYNPSHLFGFFSAFNPDVLKDVELYKSSIPAEYGGRLSSVLDITTREGNKKKFAGSGGIGPITGRLTLEGPLVKEKSSFIIGGRANYSNWLLRQLDNPDYRDSEARFYDVNAGLSYQIDEKNNLFLNGYLSNDGFTLQGDTSFDYQNQNASLKWNHLFNDKLYGVFTAGYSAYNYSINSERNPVNAFDLGFELRQTNVQADFSYFPDDKHSINFGIASTQYSLLPGTFEPIGSESLIVPDILDREQGVETALYVSDDYSITSDLSIIAGLRYSIFNYLGPQSVNEYADGQTRGEFSLVDVVNYDGGDIINTYHGPEWRVALRYSLPRQSSVKLSFNTTRQYIHMLSNTTTISPTDTWKLSDPNIRPQIGEQLSLGYYKNFRYGTIETSIETYYKRIRNFLDFKSGANLLLNHDIETDLINTQGRAYGVEMMVKKTLGKLNGWLSYTYSRTELQQDDPIAGELINEGEWYPSNFDKPHDLTLVSNYKFSHRFSLSFNFTYSTGRPITLPIAQYNFGGSDRVFYSDRNAFRIPDYYRADLAMNIEGNHKVRKLAHSSWTLAIYNLTGRRNPYSVYFTSENGEIRGYQLSIFGQPIPTVTYNFKF